MQNRTLEDFIEQIFSESGKIFVDNIDGKDGTNCTNCKDRTEGTEENSLTKLPLTNISTSDTEILFIEMIVPGFDKEDLEVQVQENHIVIKGEYGIDETDIFTYYKKDFEISSFERKFDIDKAYDLDNILVQLENSVLLISIPKKQKQEPKTRKIEIN